MKSDVLDILPLAPLQEGLLFHALYDGASGDVYVVQLSLELTGRVDGERLRAAAQALLARHPHLAARFLTRGSGQPVQVIPRTAEVPWREADLRGREGDLARLAEEERRRGFELSRPPLLRFVLVRLDADRQVLVLTVHHILVDGWSVPVLVRELFALYGSAGDSAAGSAADSAADKGVLAPAVPFRAYLEHLADRDRGASEAAWREYLAGAEPCRVAETGGTTGTEATTGTGGTTGGTGGTTGTAGAGAGTAREQIVRELDPGLSERLRAQARELGVTLGSVVLGAWGVVLGCLAGREDVVFGTTVSGRPPEIAGVESMAGLFINTVPVRVRLDPGESLGALLERVQAEQAGLLEHQYLGLADIQRLAGTGELFDTTTVIENYPSDLIGSGNADFRVTGLDAHGEGQTHYPLTLAILPNQQPSQNQNQAQNQGQEPGSGLGLRLGYRPDAVPGWLAAGIATRFTRVLAALADDPGLRVGEIDLLTERERHRLLREWNTPATETGAEASGETSTETSTEPGCLPEAFEAQAARSPEAVAVVVSADGTQITYRELNQRANRIAHSLIARGAGPERVVALALP
ncbi:MAG: AMP-binding protein, partial [Nocardiopsaceae bacterium]|nr:AMP-binding protein [Nocardiopsaceae bacterium]